ncbi:MAG: hypothetical protein NTV98_05825 [Candidatus Roizmanbacteria bacterium]|nr:hypothetical protein [Candidatus Roizmanbacteria bacterium]
MTTVLKIIKKNIFRNYVLLFTLLFLIYLWTRGGLNTFYVDTDFGRDLSQLSKLWIGQKVIWLGPTLSPGFHASPLYYYLFFPALFVGQGSAYSLLIANILFAIIVLAVLGFKRGTLLALTAIGFSPWFGALVMHPGNGFTYVLWLLLSLICLWFEFPLVFSALFLGISLSFHPAAIFALPLLIYEWVRRKRELKQAFIITISLLIPWAPIILFEIITKGFLFRQWITHPSVGMKIAPSFINLQTLINTSGISLFGFLLVFIILLFSGKVRERWWLSLSILGLIFFGVVSKVPPHYLLGLTCILYFTVAIIMVKRVWGRSLLGIITLIFLGGAFILPTPKQSPRSIEKIQSVVNQVAQNKTINKKEKIAVVAALDMENKVPQADDYRFFLRIKGFKIPEVTEYFTAQKLILFVENPQFDWKSWSTWETNEITPKRIIQEQEIEGVKVITFEKI